MSIAWYVQCDGCGDPAPSSVQGARHARALAKREEGFTRKFVDVRFLDLCPRCVLRYSSGVPEGGEKDG